MSKITCYVALRRFMCHRHVVNVIYVVCRRATLVLLLCWLYSANHRRELNQWGVAYLFYYFLSSAEGIADPPKRGYFFGSVCPAPNCFSSLATRRSTFLISSAGGSNSGLMPRSPSIALTV